MASIDEIMEKLKSNTSGSLTSKIKVRNESLKIQRHAEDISDNITNFITDELNYIANGLSYGQYPGPMPNAQASISEEDKYKLIHILKCSVEKAVNELPEKTNEFFKGLDMSSDEKKDDDDDKDEKNDEEDKPVEKTVEIAVGDGANPSTADAVKAIATQFGY